MDHVLDVLSNCEQQEDVLIQFAKVDLEKGSKLGEIVFDCCRFAPIKGHIEALTSLENGDTIEEKAMKVLQYHQSIYLISKLVTRKQGK